MRHAPLAAPSGRADLEQPRFVCRLAQAMDERLVGGKARNLARLIALGLPVPDGFVLTRPAFDSFLDENGLRSRIDDVNGGIDPSNLAGLQAKSATIGHLIRRAAIPQDIRRFLATLPDRLPEGSLVAARSSAVGEDSAHASFAGQLDSVLELETIAEIERGILTCWASYWSERALFYRAARAARLDGMGVILQRMVPARVSGVLFTRAPARTEGARPDDLVIEYCAGLGDALVSGRIDPGRLIVSRADLSIRHASALPIAALDEHIRTFLTPRRILDVARLGLRVEAELGGPQDIEWSIDANGDLWVLQARPITVAQARSTAECGETIWTNANVNENFPQPISPLLYSIASPGYYHYFRNLGLAFGVSRRRLAAMEQPLRTIIGVHGGRMYYNLTNVHAVLRLAPFGDQLAAAFNQFVGATETTAAPARRAVAWRDFPRHVAAAGELASIVLHTAWQYAFLRRRLESFERVADGFAGRTHPAALQERSLEGLLDDLRAFQGIRNGRWKNASLADAASMICYALLRRALASAGYSETLSNRLLRALPGVPSSIPPLRLWELSQLIRSDERLRTVFATEDAPGILDTIRRDVRFAAFRQAFEQFLEQWGFRSSGELMLTLPSLQEDPAPAIELLKRYLAGDGEPPHVAMARQAAERRVETSRLLRAIMRRSPAKAVAVWLLLTWTQRAVAYRERARLKQALLYTRCRRIALAIGARLVQKRMLRRGDDVFMLSCQELDEIASGRAMFPYTVEELVALRLRAHAALAVMRPQDTLRLPHGEYLQAGVGAEHDARRDEQPHVDGGSDSSTTLRGAGACGGRTEARAAVLAGIGEADRLQRGDVLVTRQTDPGWGPVFCLISGLVIERGGMLSHGAIIAREFGLPCVVGVRDATRRIAHGAHVVVDGDAGICTIHASTSPTGQHDVRQETGRA